MQKKCKICDFILDNFYRLDYIENYKRSNEPYILGLVLRFLRIWTLWIN